MKKIEQLKQLVNSLDEDAKKFFEDGNSAAGTRVRKTMQDIKILAQEIREEVQGMKNEGK